MLLKKKKVIVQRNNECEAVLRRFAFDEENDLFTALNSGKQGISKEEAEEKLEENGKNVIVTASEKSMLGRLFEALINPFNIVLFLVAVVTFFTDVVLADTRDYATSLIILVLILASSAISFFQGERSNSAAARLSKMISNKADVWRDGVLTEIPMDEVVPGDVVKLSAGDMIPGDVRFLSAKDAFVAQAALTGESAPVEKFSQIAEDEKAALTDLPNVGFMGTNMVSGSATAVILTTGNQTYFGSMAESLSGSRSKNSFERGVDSVSSLLIRFMLVMVPIIFLINGITKGDWAKSLLFAVTMAVGLIPEMLPMIMTSTLAKGAVTMSKHKVIVKNLSAIQTFGEMDILCTDKTGTLTEDKIVLEKYIDVHGNDDKRVLRHAYLNSYFQTGLKNLIDFAIINRAQEQGLEQNLSNYERVDEIPFDFTRRRMSVVLSDKTGKSQLITKGAVEEILAICSYVEFNGEILPLKGELLDEAMRIYRQHNQEGLRILAVAQKNEIGGIETFSVENEKDMVLIGFVGFLDPPKESAHIAIEALKEHGVRTVVLTGDSEGVAVKVCNKVGISTDRVLTGQDVEAMDDETLKDAIKTCNLFAKLSPGQKQRLVEAFQNTGHTVGYMGDGINDAPALRQADVGISVDSGVDIAKETADIILLKKDLMVLEEGVIEGRRTFGNIMKYIKMAASGNFGNMISVMVASIFLPFLPLLPVHILTQNLLCDFAQIGIPFDTVDKEYLEKPRRWETKSIKWFMVIMGPLSSIFDIACFVVLWWVVKANTAELAPLFQAGWFIFGTLSQILVVHMIRTRKIPFIQSRASFPLILSTIIIGVIALIFVFTPFTIGLDFAILPMSYMPWLALLLVSYCVVTQLFKSVYVRWFKEWL
ncbi:MAG TPA: magnesium-translocating P-type ATPase [Candidatus Pelethocola excrementipullorum]|nr:magnesium-translocating P-type ATPase [Candidatus Pelethocola excrementipullorum]